MIPIVDNASLSTDLDCQFNDLLKILHFYPTPPGLVQLTDPRLSDPRPMLDGSVINESVAGHAAIVQSKLNLNGVIPPNWFAPAPDIDIPSPPIYPVRGDLAELLPRKGAPNGYAAIDSNRRLLPANVTPGPGLGTVSEVLFSFPEQFDITQGNLAVPMTDGSPVSNWKDNSSNLRHATQTGSARPIFKTNVINGLPVVRFSPGQNLNISIPIPFGAAGEVYVAYVVLRVDAGKSLWFLNNTAGSVGYMGMNTDNHLYIGVYDGTLMLGGSPAYNVRDNVFHVYTVVMDEATFALDGVLKGQQWANSGYTRTPMTMIGSPTDEGDLAELIVYKTTWSFFKDGPRAENRAAPLPERPGIEKYLAQKYGLTVTGAASPVDPATVPNMIAWWKADDLLIPAPPPPGDLTAKVNWKPVPNNCWFGINGDTGLPSGGPGLAPTDPQFHVEQLPVDLIPPIDAAKFTTGLCDPEVLPIAEFGEDHHPGMVPDPGLQGDPNDYLGRDIDWHHFLSGPPYQPQVTTPSIELISIQGNVATVTIRSREPGSILFYRAGRPSFREAPPSGPDIHITLQVPRGILIEAYAAKQGYNNSNVASYTVSDDPGLPGIIDSIGNNIGAAGDV